MLWQRGSAPELAAKLDGRGRPLPQLTIAVCLISRGSGSGKRRRRRRRKRLCKAGGTCRRRVASCCVVCACDKCSAVVVAAGMMWHEVAPWPTGQLLLIRLFQL